MSAVIITDETLIIETPERVPLHFALASIGNRFIACAIDHTIQIIALIGLILLFSVIVSFANLGDRISSAPKWVIALFIILMFLLMSGYFAFFEWLWRGQKPRQRWMELRAACAEGTPIRFFLTNMPNPLADV